MTVYIEKPAVNLREELASLRNQGGYQEQQFWFENAVTNGTFDADATGWTDESTGTGSISWNASGYLNLNTVDSSNRGVTEQQVSVVSGKTYTISFEVISTASATVVLYVGSTQGTNNLVAQATLGVGTHTYTFTATTNSAWVKVFGATVSTGSVIDNISVFETDGTDVIHTMPKGWKPKDVFEDGLLQREGSAHDYELVYDGFDYFVKPTVAPSATTQTCVIGVKA